MIRVVIGGDICPMGINAPFFEAGDIDAMLDGIAGEFSQADLSVINLECPLIDEPSPAEKIGPVLSASSSCVVGLHAAGIDVVSLANNHSMDHGAVGLANTMRLCREAGILVVGAGEDLSAARGILVREIKGLKIGILSVAEHEFCIAGQDRAGTNPLNILDILRNLRANRDQFQYLVVLLHGGNEGYPYPRPSLRDVCHFLVEEGAKAVVCQHSHCAGCYETYNGGHIVYGQGNLIFEAISNVGRSWTEGFLVVLKISEDGSSEMDVVPYTQSDPTPGAHRMEGKRKEEFLGVLRKRSADILDDGFLEAEWGAFCCRERAKYLRLLHSTNRFHSILLKILGGFPLLGRLRTKKFLRLKLNLLRCESHREVLTTILSQQ